MGIDESPVANFHNSNRASGRSGRRSRGDSSSAIVGGDL